ncbi:MAG: hypothetical protein CSB33_02765 [Desulfobacterales bacterium]|nr:MAG: hypothetical protein CSB33_02765 [Desulfobacterales bacterium]
MISDPSSKILPEILKEQRQGLAALQRHVVERLNQLVAIELLERNWDGARKSIDKALDLAPDDSEAQAHSAYLDRQIAYRNAVAAAETLFAARLLASSGKKEKAVHLLSDFLDRFPDHEEARQTRNDLCAENAAPEAAANAPPLEYSPPPAAPEAFPAADFPPSSPDPEPDVDVSEKMLFRLLEDARQLAESGLADAARLSLEKILRLRENFAPAHNDLGAICHDAGKMDAARNHYARAVAEAPENAVFRKNLADFLLVQDQDMQTAMSHYLQVLQQDPEDVDALFAVGEICMLMDDNDGALGFYRRILEIMPQHEGAKRRMEEMMVSPARPASPGDGITVDKSQYGRIVIRFDDEEGAGESPVTPEGTPQNPAQIRMQELMDLLADEPENAAAHHELGLLQYSIGDKTAALQSLETAVRYAPGRPEFLKSLADFYYTESGRVAEAVDLYERTLTESPDNREVLAILGNLHLNMEEFADARFYYERLQGLMPDDDKIAQITAALREKTA